jgi:hypothetical protein
VSLHAGILELNRDHSIRSGDTSLSQTQLHWTQDGVVSPDARAKCQTALLLPVVSGAPATVFIVTTDPDAAVSSSRGQPGTDPHDGIFAIVIADSILRGYRAWQAGLAGQTTLFVGSGFDPVWQLSQQFKITCKVLRSRFIRLKLQAY